jgi:hypothetical protein
MTPDMMQLTASMLAVAFLGFRPSPARACSPPLAGPPHTLDPGEQAVDTQPPEPPEIGAIEITSHQTENSGCALGAKCGGEVVRQVRIPVTARDDRTPPDKMGYRLMPEPGAPFFGSLGDFRAKDGALTLTISTEDPFSFDLAIKSVDLAGNVSADASTTHVSEPDTAGGCAIDRRAGRGRAATSTIAALGLGAAFVVRRRRRRSE